MNYVRAELLRQLSSDKHMKWGAIAPKNNSAQTVSHSSDQKHESKNIKKTNCRSLGAKNQRVWNQNQVLDMDTKLKLSQIEKDSSFQDAKPPVLDKGVGNVREPLKELAEQIEKCLSNSRRSADLLCRLLAERKISGFTEMKTSETICPLKSQLDRSFSAAKVSNSSNVSRKVEDFTDIQSCSGNPFFEFEKLYVEPKEASSSINAQPLTMKVNNISVTSISPIHSVFSNQQLDLEIRDLSPGTDKKLHPYHRSNTESSFTMNRMNTTQYDSFVSQSPIKIPQKLPAYYFVQGTDLCQTDGITSDRTKVRDTLRKNENAPNPAIKMLTSSDVIEPSQREAPDPTPSDNYNNYLRQNQFYFPFDSKETAAGSSSKQAITDEENSVMHANSHRRVKSSIEIGVGQYFQRKYSGCFSKIEDRFTHQEDVSHKEYNLFHVH